MQSEVGSIGLECLMNRANILFTSGYRFRGRLDPAQWAESTRAVAGSVHKFRYALQFNAQTDFSWQYMGSYETPLRMVDCDDLDEAFGELCRGSLAWIENGARSPMAMAVLRSRSDPDEFILAQTSEHTYLDARSAEFLFNAIVDHYNAGLAGDSTRQAELVEGVRRISTPPGDEVASLLGLGHAQHERNLAGLASYPVADVGRYAIALREVPACLEQYRKQRFAPIVRFFPLADLLRRCRQRHPEVTQNAVICAALAKGFYTLNREGRCADERQLVSFKMLSDLLVPELRQYHAGNYIAFVPVSVDAERPVEEVAGQIHERIREFKAEKIDVSLFCAVEAAVAQGVVGTVDDALSFVVTNWNNYAFLEREEFLHGCRSIRHQSGVNIDPRDTLGAVLVNRPILVINLSAKDEVCLSFFPSLRSEAENLALAERIGEVFGPLQG